MIRSSGMIRYRCFGASPTCAANKKDILIGPTVLDFVWDNDLYIKIDVHVNENNVMGLILTCRSLQIQHREPGGFEYNEQHPALHSSLVSNHELR